MICKIEKVHSAEETEREKEVCVIKECGVETEYYKDTHIDYREYYMEGVGQFCEEHGKKYCGY